MMLLHQEEDAVTSKLNYLSKMQYAKSIVSFYFKKFYTYLPHNKLIEKISGLVNRSFVYSKAEFININSKLKALWSSKNKDKRSFNNNDIVELFTYLVNSIYVQFRGKIYKLVIDIPMGCDCAPKFDDLFLYSIMSMIIQGRGEDLGGLVKISSWGLF